MLKRGFQFQREEQSLPQWLRREQFQQRLLQVLLPTFSGKDIIQGSFLKVNISFVCFSGLGYEAECVEMHWAVELYQLVVDSQKIENRRKPDDFIGRFIFREDRRQNYSIRFSLWW